jgi:hypothetical protein
MNITTPFEQQFNIHCELSNSSLKDFFKDWKSGCFYVKKNISDEEILIRKYSSKTYGTDNVYISYSKEQKTLKIQISPVPKSYLLFALIPLICLLLINSQEPKLESAIIPISLFTFLFLVFKWGTKNTKREIVTELKKKFDKENIKYRLMIESNEM